MSNPYKNGKFDGKRGFQRRTYTSQVDQDAYNAGYNFKEKERLALEKAERDEAQARLEEEELDELEDRS